MSLLAMPNTWIGIDAEGNTRLTYALQTNPAPLTVSVPNESPQLASLQFIVTNQTDVAIPVESITFTLEAGTSGASITPTTDGVLTAVSDGVNWNVTKPGVVTSGPAPYVLAPAAGTAVALVAGASVVVEIYQMQTVQIPGTSTIAIKEVLTATAPTFTNFSVTTFPDGFFFNGLVATVPDGSSLTPVAQIDNNGTNNVTLVWNSSVTELDAYLIYYSNATSGQQHAVPTEVGQWTSPPLTSDTVFTVKVKVDMLGGQPLTAAVSTAVSVQNPDLVAANVTTATETVTGVLNVLGTTNAADIIATGATVNGTLGATTANVTGVLTGDTVNVTEALNANIATVTYGLSADTVTAATSIDVEAYGTLNVDSPGTPGGRFIVEEYGNVGIGTGNPTSKLHVWGNYGGDGTGGFILDASDSGATYLMRINPFVLGPGSVGYQFQTKSHNYGIQNALTICDTGIVGIGTNTPTQAGLVVDSTGPNQSMGSYGYLNASDPTGTVSAGQNNPYSIWASGRVASAEFNAFSDERIKDLVGSSDSSRDLATLLGIEVTDYRYKDTVRRGDGPHKKIVAQQVEKIYPQAVSKVTDVVPDIYLKAPVSDGWVMLATDLKAGDRVRLISDKAEGIYEVLESTPDKFRTRFEPDGDGVFVFGREVDDFRTVDYDAISMLHLSATQQLKKDTDREVKELRAANLALIKRLEVLERQMGVDGLASCETSDRAGY